MTTKLHLGCGKKILSGYVNVDIVKYPGVDKVCNLNKFPYPFKTSSADEILMEHCLEHLDDWEKVLKEIHRICKNNAQVTIKVPHFSCAWLNPYHVQGFNKGLFHYFHKYNKERFEVKSIRLNWTKDLSKEYWFIGILNGCVNLFANVSISFCERIWCYWVGGFEEIDYRLTVVK